MTVNCHRPRRRVAGFFETRQELASLLRWGRRPGLEMILVAVAPEADETAESQRLACHSVEDLCDQDELLRRGRQNFLVTEQLCLAVDRIVHAHLDAHAPLRQFSLNHVFYYTKMLVDALTHRALMLTRSLDRLTPEMVVYFDGPPCWRRQIVPDSLSSVLLPAIAAARRCEVVGLPSVGRRRGAQTSQAEPDWRRRVLEAASVVPRRLHGMARRRLNGCPTLVVNGLWSDKTVLKAWGSAGGLVVDCRDLRRRRSGPSSAWESVLDRCWQQLTEDPSIRGVFTIEGIDIAAPILNRLKRLLFATLTRFAEVAAAMEEALAHLPHPVVLGSAPVNIDEVACAVVARAKGIPVVICQHGGFAGYLESPMFPYAELQLADGFLCYGEGGCREVHRLTALQRGSEGKAVQPIATGSPALDRLLARRRSSPALLRASRAARARTIVYVPTALMGDWRYFSNHIYPDIWYWRLQRAVVQRCSQARHIRLIVKLDPRDEVVNPLERWTRSRRLRHCRFIRHRPFTAFLERADLFIIDNPSTTLLEALTTQKPILVFADERFLRFYPEAAELLRRRASFSTTPDAFLAELDTMLSQPEWQPPQPLDDAFLRAYGTEPQGVGLPRMLEALRGLARGNRPPGPSEPRAGASGAGAR